MKKLNKSQWLSIIGGILLAVGLLLSLFSNYYNSKVMGKAAIGVAVLSPSKDSSEWRKKIELKRISDWCFYAGIFLTLAGITAGTIGSIIKK